MYLLTNVFIHILFVMTTNKTRQLICTIWIWDSHGHKMRTQYKELKEREANKVHLQIIYAKKQDCPFIIVRDY